MELRLLTTERERKIFGERLSQARANLGLRFKEKSRSQLAKIQLMFGNLYGLFEDDDDAPESMIAGLAMHDLEMFPQSCPKPDLSHLPPRAVLEMSDFWSLSKGAGMFVWCGAAIHGNLQDPRAVLVYLTTGPCERTDFYSSIGFAKAGEPIVYPYIETLEGKQIFVQPMLLEGKRMQRVTRVLTRLASGASYHNGVMHFRDFLGLKPFNGSASPPAEAPRADRITVASGQLPETRYAA